MNFLRHALLLAIICIGLAVPLFAAATESPVAAVLRADTERLAALQAGNVVRFNELVSDELHFVHSDGRVQTRAEYVAPVSSGEIGYENVRTYDVQVMQATNDVVVLHGRLDMRKRTGSQKVDQRLMFLAVWRKEGGAWRLFAYQSARPPGSDPIPAS
jgi:ketosteroid isomerase-like protein